MFDLIADLKPAIRLPLRQKHPAELHVLIQGGKNLRAAAETLREAGWRLMTMFANDERLLEDCRFKIYYLFTAPDADQLLTIEYVLPRRGERWPHADAFPGQIFYTSIREFFPAVIPFEEAIADQFGLLPIGQEPVDATHMLADAHLLHTAFWQSLAPMRRTRPLSRLRKEQGNSPRKTFWPAIDDLPEGMRILPVGPYHAGVIETGRFLFLNAGEIIEDLPIRLGFKHKGVEKLFETHYLLKDGWQLAEKISGDAAFSHGLAYCQAVEAMAGIQVPEAAQLWRALLLEIERIANHIRDAGGILHDISLDIIASQMALQWESIQQMNRAIFGDRLLRGINRPGGVELPKTVRKHPQDALLQMQGALEKTVSLFLTLGQRTLFNASLQDRGVNTGALTREDATRYGAVGFAARASGLIHLDMRALHPRGVYAHDDIQALLRQTFEPPPDRWIDIDPTDMSGDVYARFALRLAEVETSFYLIDAFLKRLQRVPPDMINADAARRIEEVWAYEAGLGLVESWRGPVIYWVMKGPRNTIARCKVTGPSILNWFVFPLAVARHRANPAQTNILPDFPLINKSFNLSYAERDL